MKGEKRRKKQEKTTKEVIENASNQSLNSSIDN